MNGLTFFGLNFIFLGAGSAFAFSFQIPFVILSVVFVIIGIAMIVDDRNGQSWSNKVLKFFPGTQLTDVKKARNE